MGLIFKNEEKYISFQKNRKFDQLKGSFYYENLSSNKFSNVYPYELIESKEDLMKLLNLLDQKVSNGHKLISFKILISFEINYQIFNLNQFPSLSYFSSKPFLVFNPNLPKKEMKKSLKYNIGKAYRNVKIVLTNKVNNIYLAKNFIQNRLINSKSENMDLIQSLCRN